MRHRLRVLAPLFALGTALAPAQTATPEPRVVPYPIDVPASFQQAIAAGTRTLQGRPGPNYWTDRADYRLEVELDPATAVLRGKAVMTYHNRSPQPLNRLVIHLYQDLMKAGAQRTRTVVATDGIRLGEVRVGDKVIKPSVRDTHMTVRLAQELSPGGSVTLTVDYDFDVPKAGTAPRMGHEADKVFYLGYWYPQFAVHDDVEGWVADPHRGNGEFYMGYADYDLAITVPQGYLVRATGELQNAAEVLTEKAQQALVQAATSRDIVRVITKEDHDAGTVTAVGKDGKLTWRFRAENVRDAAVSIARTYLWDATHAVVKDKGGPGIDGTCMIHAVYEPNSGDWVRAAEYARHTIEFMSAHLHPYPWPHMTACEGIIGGGMEYPMMTICGGRRPAGVIAHELIHMWFPMLLGSNEKRYAWQDEGFTTFWTTLCRDDFTKQQNGPRGDVLEYAGTVARGGDVVCMRHADAYGDDNFGFGAYTKPAAMLHQLRALLGDETFFTAFRRYAADWAWKHPYPYDFFHSFQDVAKQDLMPYFRTWLFEAWQLEHTIAAVENVDGETIVRIEDRGRAVHPCVVEATFADGSKARQTVPAGVWWQGTQAQLRFQGRAIAVQIDPDITSLDVDRKNNRWQAAK
ncbi:MAG: M1 family metallopeptidase [Planctomycetes bacterium]|jgi:hypothetical protein|nr:M1 family metallopeptidase [Planctomycetota bacterium]